MGRRQVPQSQLMANMCEAVFRWPYESSNTVILTGTFDQWSKSMTLTKGPSGFEGKVRIPWGAKVAYKFIVDGNWTTVDGQPVEPDPAGNWNNVYTAPLQPLASAEPTSLKQDTQSEAQPEPAETSSIASPPTNTEHRDVDSKPEPTQTQPPTSVGLGPERAGDPSVPPVPDSEPAAVAPPPTNTEHGAVDSQTEPTQTQPPTSVGLGHEYAGDRVPPVPDPEPAAVAPPPTNTEHRAVDSQTEPTQTQPPTSVGLGNEHAGDPSVPPVPDSEPAAVAPDPEAETPISPGLSSTSPQLDTPDESQKTILPTERPNGSVAETTPASPTSDSTLGKKAGKAKAPTQVSTSSAGQDLSSPSTSRFGSKSFRAKRKSFLIKLKHIFTHDHDSDNNKDEQHKRRSSVAK